MKKITAHVIVKNEENFIWFALMSVLDYVEKILVYDTGSKDKTVEIIKTIKSPKIIFAEKGKADLKRFIFLRQEQVNRTKTEWFLVLDGDEVWPKDSIKSLVEMINQAPPHILAIVNRTRNCVGDIYHYLPEEAGRYKLLGRIGHLTFRATRKTPDLTVQLMPPFNAQAETYVNKNGSLPFQDKNFLFLDKYYWHLTHLRRSHLDDHGKEKLELGVPFDSRTVYPEVFSLERPPIVPDPFVRINKINRIKAAFQTPLKKIKRKIMS